MERKRELAVREPFYAFVIVFYVIVVLIYALLPREQIFYASATIYPIIALMPFVVYLFSARKVGFSWEDKFSVLIVFNALGALFWFIAEIIWCYYYNLLLKVEVPYPSEADIFYIGAAVLVILGISLYMNSLYQDIKEEISARERMVAIFFLVILTIVVAAFLLYPISTYAAEEEPIVVTLDITYVALDVLMSVLLFASILLIRGRIGKILMFFLLGCLMIVAYDSCFAYLTLADLYYDGHPVELLDIASYFFDACAFYETYKLYK